MLDRLMGGPVLAQVDGVVGPDEDRWHLHQRADPERAAAVVGEHQEAGPVGPETRQRHAVGEGTHGVLADAEMEVAPAVVSAVTRRLEFARALEGQECLGRGPQIGRPAQQPGHSVRDRVLRLGRRVAAGDALGIGRKDREVLVPVGRQRVSRHAVRRGAPPRETSSGTPRPAGSTQRAAPCPGRPSWA